MQGRILAVLALVFAVNYMDRQLVAILIDPIQRDLGISDAAAGALYGLTFAVFYSVVGVPIAWWADRVNRCRLITAALVLFSAMTALSGFAVAYWQLLLARIGVGVGEAGTSPPSHSIIADLYPVERRSTAMSIFTLGPHVGVIFAFLFGGALAQGFGWRAVFWAAGAMSLLVALIAAFTLDEPTRTARRGDTLPPTSAPEAVRAVIASPSMRHLFAGATLVTAATAAILAWLPAFLVRVHGLSLSATGAWLAFAIGGLGGFGLVLGGWTADRLGARDPAWRLRITVLAGLVAAPIWGIAIMAESLTLALVAIMIGGALFACHVGPTFAMVQTLARPDARAFTASLLLGLTNLVGVGVGPMAVGLLSDAWSDEYRAGSLRIGLMIAPPLWIWAAFHYEAAARRIAPELRSATIEAREGEWVLAPR